MQKALDALMESSQMTVFVIAHRLSTIRNADIIAVLSDGKVAESGTHDELVAQNGLYNALVQNQRLNAGAESEDNKKLDESMRQSTRGSSGNLEADGRREALIEFENIGFTYPARPDVKVFKHLNLTVNKGETLALCGPSGQGKSTVIQLVERFYDPDEGRILYNGKDVRDLNVAWWRNELGLVAQEPTLFDCTGKILVYPLYLHHRISTSCISPYCYHLPQFERILLTASSTQRRRKSKRQLG